MIHERNDEHQPKIAYYLLAPVLEVAHERLLHTIELGKLDADCLARALQILRALSEVLAAFDACRRHCESALSAESIRQQNAGDEWGKDTFTLSSSLTLFRPSIVAFSVRISLPLISSCCLRSWTSLTCASRLAAYCASSLF